LSELVQFSFPKHIIFYKSVMNFNCHKSSD